MTRFDLASLAYPIVQAPMAGGPSTPELAAAVSNAGGLGFLAAGYKPVDALSADVRKIRSLLDAGAPFGVNVFAPPGHGRDVADVAAYGEALAAEVTRAGVPLGVPRWDDDHYAAKLELLCAERVPVASFTFGCPSAADVNRLHAAEVAVWGTATTVAEAEAARTAGVDALVLQGVEAGGHRGSADDAAPGDLGVLALLQLVRAAIGADLPLVAAGGLATGAGIAAVLTAGAMAAGVGTALLLADEAGTAVAQRAALAAGAEPTALTRAFTGRTARGIVNRFLREHTAGAPSAYPEVHHLTAALRAAARERGDTGGFHLWAGQAYPLTRTGPADHIVRQLVDGARAALREASERL